MKKISILMVLGNTGRGGAQAYVMNILRNIDWSRFQIDIAACGSSPGDFRSEMESLGCRVQIIPYFKVTNYISYKKAWNKLLSENHYDIVHAHATNAASLFLKLAKKHGCSTIAHSHSAGYRGSAIVQLVKKIFSRGTKHFSDDWFACSDKAAIRLYGKNYASSPKYYNIPNAINAEKYLFDNNVRKRIRMQYGIGEDEILYGHVGTFSAPKNHMYLLDIFEVLNKRKSNIRLMMCGEGILMESVKQYAHEIGIYDRLIFTNNVKNVNEHMMAMDTLIFPSVFEGLPVTIVEAQATGLPVVMSDVITREVDLTDVVSRCSLQSPLYKWADTIEKCCVEIDNRQKYNKLIIDSRFNMNTSIVELMRLYEELLIFKN